jgi:hypothetical protein
LIGTLTKRHSRKIDFRLLPILAALYTIALVDRTNLGGARISGIDQAIGLDQGDHYSVVGESEDNIPTIDKKKLLR